MFACGEQQLATTLIVNGSAGVAPEMNLTEGTSLMPLPNAHSGFELKNLSFFQIKVSVYKNGKEAAWVKFSKNPGTNDNWFRPRRVKNCHPWSKARLKAASTVMDMGLPSENMYWLISEGSKYSSQPIGTRTPHAHWLVIKGSNACDMAPNVGQELQSQFN